MKIKIKADGDTGFGTKVTTEDGQEINGVVTIKVLPITCDRPLEAMLTLRVDQLDITAHPLLGLDTVINAAAAHGYKLVPSSGLREAI